MTPQELKNSILLLAVQGKLVEQRVEEGDTEQLLLHIQAEREGLIKDGVIKKEQPLAAITEDEIPYEIPDNWKWYRLGSVIVSCFTGKNPKYESTPNNYYCIGQKNNQEYGINLEDLKYVTSDFWKSVPFYYFLNKGDVLVNTLGTGTMGRTGVWSNEVDKALCDSCVLVLRTNNESLSAYLLAYLRLNRRKLEKLATGTTNQKSINRKAILNYLVPIPPLAEQKRIVSKIRELMPLIGRYEKAWKKLDSLNNHFPTNLQKSLIHAAIQGKLVQHDPSEGTGQELFFQIKEAKAKLIKEGIIKKEKPLAEITDEEIPFEIPDTWMWVRLGEIIKFQGGYAYKSTSYVPSSGNQVIRLGNVKPNNLLLDTKQVFIPDEIAAATEDYLIKENDILVTMTGTRKKRDYFFTLKVSPDYLEERQLYINQRVGCLRKVGEINVSYLLYVLQSEAIKDLIFAKETGTANQGNIGSEDMKSCILIPLPPLAEQNRIVTKIEELLPLCKRLII